MPAARPAEAPRRWPGAPLPGSSLVAQRSSGSRRGCCGRRSSGTRRPASALCGEDGQDLVGSPAELSSRTAGYFCEHRGRRVAGGRWGRLVCWCRGAALSPVRWAALGSSTTARSR